MQLRRVAVVYKKTRYEKYMVEERDPAFQQLADTRPAMWQYLVSVYDDNRRALEAVLSGLSRAGVESREIYLADLEAPLHDDLVISVGGDGTLLAASHFVIDRPVVSVNSSPQSSVGFFSCATAETFAETLDEIAADALPAYELARMRITINGAVFGIPVLNDVLFAHRIPAATTRYSVALEGRQESHRSSGIWISTAAGSTAAMRSAGGHVMPLESRALQYLVRELYRPIGPTYELVGGVIDCPLTIVTNAMRTSLFIDGH
ncbi:MAG: NAD(+)/NADH kinase, partial [Myxococcales bacterium]|nr:NAD(+)/NADH kinase [Myxococcales bacterium]